jgi:hypothetical protein
LVDSAPAIGAVTEHRKAGDEHRLADHQRIVAADAPEIERIEIGQAVEADAHDEGEQRAEAKLRLVKALRSTIGKSTLNAPEEHHAADRDDNGAMKILSSSLNQSLAGPSSSTYSRRRGRRHDSRPHQSNFLNSLKFRLVEIDEVPGHADGDDDARDDIDQEQPVPGEGMAEIAADGRADGRRQRRDEADDRRDDGCAWRRERS